MFKKKNAQQENKMTYFLGGTAVGMAAGLLFRKLLSNSSGGHTRNPESDVYINKNGNTYSQDDNIHNLHIKKSTASCRTRSKSASQYEEMNMNNSAECRVPLNKFDKDLKCNAANLDINYKCDKNIPKYFYNNKDNTLYNISMEGNIEHNLHSKILSEDCEDKKNIDNNETSKPEGTKREPEDNGSMKNDNLIKELNIQSTNDNNNNKKETTQKQIEAEDHIELTDSFNSFSNDFCENFTSNINLENVNNSRTFNPNILLDCGDNLSNNATYNNSVSLNNEDDTNRSNSCYSDEFHETDLISSTKPDNVEKM